MQPFVNRASPLLRNFSRTSFSIAFSRLRFERRNERKKGWERERGLPYGIYHASCRLNPLVSGWRISKKKNTEGKHGEPISMNIPSVWDRRNPFSITVETVWMSVRYGTWFFRLIECHEPWPHLHTVIRVSGLVKHFNDRVHSLVVLYTMQRHAVSWFFCRLVWT